MSQETNQKIQFRKSFSTGVQIAFHGRFLQADLLLFFKMTYNGLMQFIKLKKPPQKSLK